jgi:glucose-6-phosphate 1-dehydrogenase
VLPKAALAVVKMLEEAKLAERSSRSASRTGRSNRSGTGTSSTTFRSTSAKYNGYRCEEGVLPESEAEMFIALECGIDNWRWAGVPFYLRSGKRLAKRVTEVAIEFKGVPHRFFHRASGELLPNVLRLHIQPDEGVSLKFGVKVPGSVLQIQSVYMDFPYAKLGAAISGGYERLLLDVTHGDQTLFIRGDEVEHAWEVLTPLLQAWERVPPTDFPNYAAGTFGPEAADKFVEKDLRRWRTL